jgi:L-lactate dehydrogenase complex protein LldE
MRIALFVTCLVDAMFPRVGQATVMLLERLGHEVVFPTGQTCCGQMHVNTGYRREAVPVVAHHVEVFERALAPKSAGGLAAEVIVAPSGSCVASVRHQHPMVVDGTGHASGPGHTAGSAASGRAGRSGGAVVTERTGTLADRTRAVSARTYELSELLVDVLGVSDIGARYPHRVTYHPTCHALRLLRVDDKPVRLLRAVDGIDLVELPQAESCCGFGGTFALKNAEVSTAMLADKLRNVQATGAEVVTAGDVSCLMHLGGGLSRSRAGVRAVHLAEILAGENWEAGR